MRIELITLRPTSGEYRLVYPWNEDLPAESQLIDIFQVAHLENPSDVNDNVVNTLISEHMTNSFTFSPDYITWKNGKVHLCRGCGLMLSDIDMMFCSDECRIRSAHSL